jgi:plasmid stabilization system protein ParE
MEEVWSVRLRFAPRARADIADIYQYITQHNTSAANSVVRQIRETSVLLARYPGLGRETDIPEVRVFPTARYPYLVYHRVLRDELIVIHVRDGRRDAPDVHEL